MTHPNPARVMFAAFFAHVRRHRRMIKQGNAPLSQTIIPTKTITVGR